MDQGSHENNQDINNDIRKDEVSEDIQPKVEQPSFQKDMTDAHNSDVLANVAATVAPVDVNGTGQFNMEASMTADEVARAGGFGARDDISSFLPVASDSTDFEASLRDARGYEDFQEEIHRPGLGWKDNAL